MNNFKKLKKIISHDIFINEIFFSKSIIKFYQNNNDKFLSINQYIDMSSINRPGGNLYFRYNIKLDANGSAIRVKITDKHTKSSTHLIFKKNSVIAISNKTKEIINIKNNIKIDFILLENCPSLLFFYISENFVKKSVNNVFFAGRNFIDKYTISFNENTAKTSSGETIKTDDGSITHESSSVRIDSIEYSLDDVKRVIKRWNKDIQETNRMNYLIKNQSFSKDINIKINNTSYNIRESDLTSPEYIAYIIGGSGSHDRFGFSKNLDLGYGQIASFLTNKNIKCINFDKPIININESDNAFQQMVNIYHDLIKFLNKKYFNIPKIYIGHSEGGIISSIIAEKEGNISDMICLICTPATKMIDVVYHQMNHERPKISDDIFHQKINQIKNIYNNIDNNKNSYQDNLVFNAVKWIKNIDDLNYQSLISLSKNKILFIEGGRDGHLLPNNTEVFKKLIFNNKNVSYVNVNNMNHYMREEEDSNKQKWNITNEVAKNKLDNYLLSSILKWIYS